MTNEILSVAIELQIYRTCCILGCTRYTTAHLNSVPCTLVQRDVILKGKVDSRDVADAYFVSSLFDNL